NRWNSKPSLSPILLRNHDGLDRRGEVAPRRHPIPNLVQVTAKVPLKLCNRFLVYTRSPSIGLDPPERIPDESFRDIERLCHVPKFLPPKRLTCTHDPMTRPLRSTA